MHNNTWGKSWLDGLCLFFCRIGVAGLAPKAPGTVGSLAALLLAPWCFLPLTFWPRIGLLLLIFFLGAMASTQAEKCIGAKDPGQIVIDELLGMWLTLLFFNDLSWLMLGAAFIFFRIFDIAKPWPVKASEKWLPSGYGIMIDDVFAGVYAALCLGVLHIFM